MRRTTIILYGIVGGAVMLGGVHGDQPRGATGRRRCVLLLLIVVGAAGLFVLAGATPAAIGLLADMTEAYPDDRGAIMGLYSVFLGHGPDLRQRSSAGWRRSGRASTGSSSSSFVMLGIALLPLGQLRRYEHLVGCGPARLGARGVGSADG